MKHIIVLVTLLSAMLFSTAHADEILIGKERIKPGIVFVFEGAQPDHHNKPAQSAKKAQQDKHANASAQMELHVEVKANWDEKNIPEGTPSGGFIPYLDIIAKITNQMTSATKTARLSPYINLADNFHYAKDVMLPGKVSDRYTVEFKVVLSKRSDLTFHKDWLKMVGSGLVNNSTYKYKDISFTDLFAANH